MKHIEGTPVALVSLNAKFIHSNLAIDYLRAYCEAKDVPAFIQTVEFHINQPVDYIVGEILSLDIDVVGFSCYIWNITPTLQVITRLKLAKPETIVIIGGPEVSYEPERILLEHPEIDYCIVGEGEESFAALLSRLIGENHCSVTGERMQPVATKMEERIIQGQAVDLGRLPSPYPVNLKERYCNKLVYVETSRGCPFACQYCLSANTRGVRYFPKDKVEKELTKLMDGGFPQIKFIDRTFNANPKWAMDIFQFLVRESEKRGAFEGPKPPTVFHFEISADILTEELLSYLRTVPSGLFQFEIGIQSTTPKVLEEISRKSDWSTLRDTIEALSKPGNIHLHLDLIAGLPHETYESFGKSFDDVYGLKGHRIQLGFLKLLKGSGLRCRSSELGLVFDPYPPYEIISTPTLGPLELVQLKEIESLLEQYHNSHRFSVTMELLSQEVYDGSPFRFLEDLAKYFRSHKLHQVSHSPLTLYDILYGYVRAQHSEIAPLTAETLKFDFLRTEAHRPLRVWMPDKLGSNHRRVRHQLLQDSDVLARMHPATISLPPRDLARYVRVGRFSPEFVEFLVQRAVGGMWQEPQIVGDSAGSPNWVLFDHHRPNPWTDESSYTVVMEDR